MAITPWYKGDTAPAWIISLIPDSGTFNVSGLSASNFALRMRNTDTNVVSTGTGTFSGITATSGSTPASVVYQPSAADVATLGNFALFVVVTFPNGSIETFSIGTWQVIAL